MVAVQSYQNDGFGASSHGNNRPVPSSNRFVCNPLPNQTKSVGNGVEERMVPDTGWLVHEACLDLTLTCPSVVPSARYAIVDPAAALTISLPQDKLRRQATGFSRVPISSMLMRMRSPRCSA